PDSELPEQVGSDPQSDDAADDRAIATPGQPRYPPGRLAEGGRDASPDRKLAHGRRCYPATGADSAPAAEVRSSLLPIMNKLVPKRRQFQGFCAIQDTGRQERHGTVLVAGARWLIEEAAAQPGAPPGAPTAPA